MKAVWVICGVLVAGVLIGWVSTGGWGKQPPPLSPAPSAKEPPVVWSAPRRVPGALAATTAKPPAEPAANPPAPAETNWQNQVGEMLVSDLEESDKARQVLELFPSLPEEGQVQVAEQLSFMLGDEDYPLLARFLTDGTLSEPVLEALLTGALLRSDEIKAPLLLTVASDERHPKAQEARTLLEDMLGRQLSDDPRLWPAAVQQWLQSARNTGP